MVRRAAVGLVIVLGAVIAIALLAAGTAAPTGLDGPEPPQTTPEGFTNAEFEIRVYANGSARWTVRASRPLDNQTEIDQFRSFEESFESTETDAFRNFRLRARRLVAFGTNATGREMNATRFSRDARVVELGQTRGVVELSFLWTNFARTDGERVIVDDVFEGGMFVDNGQRLVMASGPEIVFQTVNPPPDSQSVEGNLTASETVTWLGKRDFTDQRPRAVFVPPELASEATGSTTATASDTGTATPTTAADGNGDGSNGGSAEDGDGGLGMLPFVVVLVVLLGIGGGFALYSGTAGGVRPWSRGEAGTDAEPTGTAEPGPPPASAKSSVPDEELLSDEDHVLQLLEKNGGRMKQVNIVEETDWSKSKVSMLLSDMEEEDKISKLRVGRENIITKAGEEPDAFGSPFDDE